MELAPIEAAVRAIRRGEIVIVVDDADRENEGDLILAGEHATAERLAFFVQHTSGLICTAVTNQRADDLDLPLMVRHNTEVQGTAFTVTVDARTGTTTGISAADRATTIRAVVDQGTRPGDLSRPGHLHVLRARDGGVLKRPGHTEAAVDLARLAGLAPVGVLCEVVSEDGLAMAGREELERLAAAHGLLIVSIADLIRYRWRTERLVRRVAEARVPTDWGDFTCVSYESLVDGETHLALVVGEPSGKAGVLVRVHSECLTGDVFGSRRCDCGSQLHMAMGRVAAEGTGVIVYLRGHEGRGIGISHKLCAYNLQDGGLDTVDANLRLGLPVDSREYGVGAQILRDLGVTAVRLMTNNPDKSAGLEDFGLTVLERVAVEPPPTPSNIKYLRTKRDRLGHLISGVGAVEREVTADRVVAAGGIDAVPQRR